MKLNPENERATAKYFEYRKEADGADEATIDAVAKAIARFEEANRYKCFSQFRREWAIAFKRTLSAATNRRTGDALSKATQYSTLRTLRAFFRWLAREPGYRSKLNTGDADYFNMSDKDAAIARAHREKPVPTLAQVDRVLAAMPTNTEVERRDRAVFALAAITAARSSALASFQIGDINIQEGYVDQDARHVRTKASKTFRTVFVPFSRLAMAIFREWYDAITRDPSRGPTSPLFPATATTRSNDGSFHKSGLKAEGWQSSAPVRAIFKRAYATTGDPYHKPHLFRDTLIHHGMRIGLSLEALKALSQNIGHTKLSTTMANYGHVPMARQTDIIRGFDDWQTQQTGVTDQQILGAIRAMIANGQALPNLLLGQ